MKCLSLRLIARDQGGDRLSVCLATTGIHFKPHKNAQEECIITDSEDGIDLSTGVREAL